MWISSGGWTTTSAWKRKAHFDREVESAIRARDNAAEEVVHAGNRPRVGAIWSNPDAPDGMRWQAAEDTELKASCGEAPASARAGHFYLKCERKIEGRGRLATTGRETGTCGDSSHFAISTGCCWVWCCCFRCISILEIYSATLHTKFVGFETKQIFWLVGGLAAMFVFSLIDYHRLLDLVHWIYGFCLVSLVAVLVAGQKVLGARRWIQLPGGIHFQPSEWVKLVLIVAVARYFANLARQGSDLEGYLQGVADGWVPMLLVLKQPDLGTSLTYIPVLIVGLFLGGLDWKKALIILRRRR